MSKAKLVGPILIGAIVGLLISFFLFAPAPDAGPGKVAAFEQRASLWFTDLDRATAKGFAAVGSGDLSALSEARSASGRLFLEISALPDDAPGWIAPCEHTVTASMNALDAAKAGRMNGSPDSFATQSQRYLRASEACKKAIDGRQKL